MSNNQDPAHVFEEALRLKREYETATEGSTVRTCLRVCDEFKEVRTRAWQDAITVERDVALNKAAGSAAERAAALWQVRMLRAVADGIAREYALGA
jgi:hypothetical protein